MASRVEHHRILKSVREQRRFELADVASYTKISLSSLGRFEAGDSNPSTVQLHKLADAYGVKMYHLAGNALPNLPAGLTDFRRIQLEPSKLKPAGLKRITLAEKIANFSNQISQTINYKSTAWNIEKYLKSDIIDLAAKMRSDFDVWNERRGNNFEFTGSYEAKIFGALRIYMEIKGIIVQNNAAPSNEYMGFLLNEDSDRFKVAFVNREISSKKAQLFTLVHELAHAIFNMPGISNPFNIKNDYEKKCNRFAAEFLAPEREFRSVVEAANGRVRASAEDLIIYVSMKTLLSRQASAMRLRETGYVSQSALAAWFSKFSRNPKLEKDSEDASDVQIYGVSHVKRVGEIGYLPTYLSAIAFDKGIIDTLDIKLGIGLAETQQDKAFRLARRRFEVALA